jgi:hypothetical protein
MSKTTSKQRVDIIEAYLNLIPMIELAKRYGLTRQGVHKIIRNAGVDTAKTGGIEVSCDCCQKIIKRFRSHVRKAKHIFCGNDCYTAWLQAGAGTGPFIANRQGMRIARTIVSRFFTLLEGHVVHHKDRNQFHNDPANLLVFRCSGDHIRHHRGFEVEPLWDGANIKLSPQFLKHIP